MLATALSVLPMVPRVVSADDLCRAMRSTESGTHASWHRDLDRVLRHDPDGGDLEVQAGVSWSALAGVAGARHFDGTVGESVARNRPGPDGEPLVAHVRAFTVATADGHLRRASRERAPELFRLAAGGFGAFGPFYSVTLDIDSLARASHSTVPTVELAMSSPAQSGTQYAVEVLLPPERLDNATSRLRAAVTERRCALTRMNARRALPEKVTLLRWATREYVVLRIEFMARPTLAANAAAEQLRRRLLDIAIEAGGSFMPASLPAATRAQAEACYPMLGEFLAEKRRLDPGNRVCFPWIRDTARTWRSERCRVRFG
jgi:FAD/FMN-containing dehydrogenase